jgi:hypothetical protein
LSTTNPTRPHLGSNPGRCRGKPATSRLSYNLIVTQRAKKFLDCYGTQGFIFVFTTAHNLFLLRDIWNQSTPS